MLTICLVELDGSEMRCRLWQRLFLEVIDKEMRFGSAGETVKSERDRVELRFSH